MAAFKVYLLGSPLLEQVIDQKIYAVDIQRRKAQALLFYLLLTGEPQHRGTLTALLWPESDHQRAHGSLRRHLSELNTALGGDWISTVQGTVGLAHPANLWVDVFAFQQLLAACQNHNHVANSVCPACIEPLSSAVALYRADFLAGFTLPDAPAFDEWQFFQTEGLRQSYATALEQLVQAHRAQAEVAAAIPYARRRLSLDPLHEPAHRQLMQLYAASGQQSAALRQFEVCVQTLRDELDVLPDGETMALFEQIRQGGVTTVNNKGRSEFVGGIVSRHNLPAATTPLIGRVKELAAVIHLCQDETRRLITILGPGGIGKTRLALEVAAKLVDGAAQGVYIVRLAQLNDPANITSTIAAALDLTFQSEGRTPDQQLFAYLQQKQIVLVLDNFDHLLDGVGLVQELLQSCPTLRLLVTSRARLQLMGETVFTLGSLNFPTWEMSQDLQNYDAIQLFIETAQRIRLDESMNVENMQYIARICRIVGGVPLGIILAASWIEVLSPAEITAELTQSLDLLETELHDLPERQRSMRAVLTYSWQRLTLSEQTVFMRLALFRGGFTRAAAEEVAGASLPILARLVDKSFIQRTSDKRYDIHELMRQYGEQQLEIAGTRPTIQRAHAIYSLNFLHECESKMAGAKQVEAILQLEADFENIRAAWHWASQTHNYGLLDCALNGLFRWFFWLRRSRQREGVALLQSTQQTLVSESPQGSGQNAHRLWGRIQARILEQQGPWLDKPVEARARIEQALALAQQQDDQAEVLFCTWALGLAIVSEARKMGIENDMQSAVQCFEQCLVAYRAREDHFWLGQTLETLGHTYRRLNLSDRAIPLLEESLALRRTQEDRFGIARSLRELAWARFTQGLERETLDAAQAAYALHVELDDQPAIADSRFFLALCLLCRGEWQHAKDLLNLVHQFAAEMNNELYQKWTSAAFTIANCMEQNMCLLQLASCSFPNRFGAFTTRLCYLIFSMDSTVEYRNNLQKLFLIATTEQEIAACILFAADLLRRAGKWHRAVMTLALGLRYSQVAESWITHLPGIVGLPQELRNHLPQAEFAWAWEQGLALDLQVVAAELSQLVANNLDVSTPIR